MLRAIHLSSSYLLRLPNELLTRILMSVADHVDRYCLGLSCGRMFTICEEIWLSRYHEAFRRPKLLVTVDSVGWAHVPEHCAYLLEGLHERKSVLNFEFGSQLTQDAFDADAFLPLEERTIPVEKVIDRMPVLPQPFSASGTTPESDPLAILLRQLGDKVWKRILDRILLDHENLSTIFSSADYSTAYAAAISTDIPEALVLCRSLMFHIPTTIPPPITLPSEKRRMVLRNHTKKIFVLEEPLRSVFEKCFPKSPQALDLSTIAFYQVLTPTLLDRLVLGLTWAGDELDVVSVQEFQMDLRLMTIETSAEWVNQSGKVMEKYWEGTVPSETTVAESVLVASKAYLNAQLHPGLTSAELRSAALERREQL